MNTSCDSGTIARRFPNGSCWPVPTLDPPPVPARMHIDRQRMTRVFRSCRAFGRCAICLVLSGCHTFGPLNWGGGETKPDPVDNARHYELMARQIEYPKVATPENPAATDSLPPRTLDKPGELQYWDLTLEEAMRIAMANSTVIHDVGGRVVMLPRQPPRRLIPQSSTAIPAVVSRPHSARSTHNWPSARPGTKTIAFTTAF